MYILYYRALQQQQQPKQLKPMLDEQSQRVLCSNKSMLVNVIRDDTGVGKLG